MSQTRIGIGLLTRVLGQENEHRRFEKFAAKLVSRIEGDVPVLLTSGSYDEGQDGRSVGPGPRIVVAATIGSSLDEKMQSDLAKVARLSQTFDKVYFLTTQEDSERQLNKIKPRIAELFDYAVDIVSLDVRQISQICSEMFPEIALDRYGPEIRDEAVVDDGDDLAQEADVLELAMSTCAAPDSTEMRRTAYRLGVLSLLHGQTEPVPTSLITKRISNKLKLGRTLPVTPVETALIEMESSGLVSRTKDDYWLLSDHGHKQALAHREDDQSAWAEGETRVMSEIESTLSTPLNPGQRAQIWSDIKSEIALLFFNEGRKILRMLAPILSNDDIVQAAGSQYAIDRAYLVRRIGEAAARSASSPLIGKEIIEAVRQMFAARGSESVAWLGRVCAAYVVVCTLGLEHTTAKAIRGILGRMSLVIDTDIILELLAYSEPDTAGVNELIRKWRQLGGTVYVSTSVMEEVAYHAWIARHEFQSTDLRDLIRADRVDLLTKSVFVRSFARLCSDQKHGTKIGDWGKYLGQYVGRSKYDFSRVREILVSDFGMTHLSESEDGTYEKAFSWLKRRIERSSAPSPDQDKRIDKARRDSRTFSAVVRKSLEFADRARGETCHLVSSSNRFSKLSSLFGGDDELLTMFDALFLVSLVPDVSVGMTSLKSALFDGGLFSYNDDMTIIIERVLRQQERFRVPAARRSAVRKAARETLIRLSKETKDPSLMPETVIRAAEERESAREALVKSISQAIETHASSERMEEENVQLRRRVAELEKKLSGRLDRLSPPSDPVATAPRKGKRRRRK